MRKQSTGIHFMRENGQPVIMFDDQTGPLLGGEMAWGDNGLSGHRLACNILQQALVAMGYRGGTCRVGVVPCFDLTAKMALKFQEHFIEPIHPHGGFFSWRSVKSYIYGWLSNELHRDWRWGPAVVGSSVNVMGYTTTYTTAVEDVIPLIEDIGDGYFRAYARIKLGNPDAWVDSRTLILLEREVSHDER